MSLPDLVKLKDGDEDEWDAFYNFVWPVGFAVAKKMLYYRWPDEVEDIAIASITKLIRHVPKVRKLGELKALLAKITHDECVGFIRKNLAEKHGGGNVISLDEIIEAIGDQFAGSSGSEDVVNHDLIRLIMKLTDQLKPKERLVFEEFHINGLSYEEISNKHDIKIGSVGVYLKRALEKLRKLLREKGEVFL